jgi:hypothetical protein
MGVNILWFGTMLVVMLTFTSQIIYTEAWGWFGGGKSQKEALQVARPTHFDMDSGQVLATTARGKELYEQSTSLMAGLRQCANNVPTASCVRDLDDHQNRIFLAWFIDVAAMCHYMQ